MICLPVESRAKVRVRMPKRTQARKKARNQVQGTKPNLKNRPRPEAKFQVRRKGESGEADESVTR